MRRQRRGARPLRQDRASGAGQWRERLAAWRRACLWAGGILAVGAAAVGGAQLYQYLTAPSTFPLQSVRFDSRLEHVRQAELHEALDPLLGPGFWGLEVAAIRGSLEALPWVRTAKVRRVWPGTLQITIREHRAVARWNEAALLSAGGEVFEPARGTWPDDLPELEGPSGRAVEVGERYRGWRDVLAGAGEELRAVKLDARESWRLRLEGGGIVELGRQDVDARLSRFIDALPALADEQDEPLVAADLRYPNGFAVRWGDAPGGEN